MEKPVATGELVREERVNVPFDLGVTVGGNPDYVVRWYRKSHADADFIILNNAVASTIGRIETATGVYLYRAFAYSCGTESKGKYCDDIRIEIKEPCAPINNLVVEGAARRTASVGVAFELKANVAGNPSRRFKWYRKQSSAGKFSEIPAAAGVNLVCEEPAGGSYVYKVVAWPACGTEAADGKSAETVVAVNEECPSVTSVDVVGSSSVTVEAGVPFIVEVAVAGGTDYSLKWYRKTDGGNYEELTGYNLAMLIYSESTGGTYTYKAVAWNPACEAESDGASTEIVVTVGGNCPPVTSVTLVSTNQPNETVNYPFVMAIIVTGNYDNTVQWYRSADNGATYQPIAGANGNAYKHVESAAGTYLYRAVVKPRCGGDEVTSASMVVTVSGACDPVTTPNVSSNLPNEKTDVAFILQASVSGGNQDYAVQWMRAKVSGDNQCPGATGNGSGTANFVEIYGATSLNGSQTESTPGVYKYKVRIWPRCGTSSRDGKESGVITVTVSCRSSPSSACPGYLATGGEYRANTQGYIVTGAILMPDAYGYGYYYKTFTFARLTSDVYVGNQPYFSPTGKDLCFFKRDALVQGTYVDLHQWQYAAAGCADPYSASFHDGTSGWRLPNIAELGQLQNGNMHSRLASEPTSASGTTNMNPSGLYWSRTEESYQNAYIWIFTQYERGIGYYKAYGSSARCVKTL